MINLIEDLDNSYQWAYTRVVERLEKLESQEVKSEEDSKTIRVYKDIESYLIKKVNQKEFLVIDGNKNEYAKGLVKEFVESVKKEIEILNLGLVIGDEYEGINRLIDCKVKHGDIRDWKTLVDVLTTVKEIRKFNEEYLVTENLLDRAIRKEVVKKLKEFEINSTTVETEGTLNVYKTLLYGHVYGREGDLEPYQVEWLWDLGYTGRVDTEEKRKIAIVVGRVCRIMEGGFREPTVKEKEVGDRFLKELKEEINKREVSINVEVYPLDSKHSKVIYIGNNYEVIVRKRMSVHKDTGVKTSHQTLMQTNSVHKMRVKSIENIAKSIVNTVQ